MTVLPQLERDLVDAARERLARAGGGRQAGVGRIGARDAERLRPRGLRLALVVIACLLASATVGLAAIGVLPIGSPVPPSGTTNPRFGLGVPRRGSAHLLPLRIPDPEGGPPWGMRIIKTTRGESCIQIGRVQRGQLGQLGVDGAFHDDERFHPLPVDALPALTRSGRQPAMGARADCRLPDKAIAGEIPGLDRNGAQIRDAKDAPLARLREISYGILGPQAVKVAYRESGVTHEETVVPGLGAYLIVIPASPRDRESSGFASLGGYGRLQASGAVSAITYRLNGKLCERGGPQPPTHQQRLPDKCPFFRVKPSERPPARTPNLHEKLNVHLSIGKHAVTALHVSFAAPYPIRSAKWEYGLEVPSCTTRMRHGGLRSSTSVIFPGSTLQRDVAKGSTVHFSIANPFGPRACRRRPLTIDVRYRHAEGGGPGTLVGSATVSPPKGAKPRPPKAG